MEEALSVILARGIRVNHTGSPLEALESTRSPRAHSSPNSITMRCCLLLSLVVVAGAQYNPPRAQYSPPRALYSPPSAEGAPRPGDCPPALPVGICYASCLQDADCDGFYKCCPTSCGGTFCSRPVTARRFGSLKAGTCPTTPRGRWVCSDTCTTDSDCAGRAKCCRNRCGALACSLPDN